MIKFVKVRRLKLNSDKMVRAIENSLTGAAHAAKIDFDVTTQTWKNRPQFTIQTFPGRRIVSTDDLIYKFVDAGTKPHEINPVRAPFLIFQGNYQAKTTPRVIASNPGGASGPTIMTIHVDHPGTEARNFAETIKEKWDRELPEIMQRAIDAEMQ